MSEDNRSPLGETRLDVFNQSISTLVGAVPCLGPMIQVALNTVIPNIRLERIEKYILYLQERIDELTFKNSLATMAGIDLFEEGIWQSARAFSDERKLYIAELVSKGMISDGIDKQKSRHFLRILSQLDDSQIIILCSYQQKYQIIGNEDARNFYKIHRDVLGPFSREIRIDNNDRGKAELKDSFEKHLGSFGLLNIKGEDTATKRISYEISMQGKYFLDFIGMAG